ncbi:MAG: NAD(P)-dependent glycerol-3-phosphate dehydrogenase [Deltaproteobacteria bacterium]|nr:NAD(P)-dependent glycerol-3-phosphate dehydrogenase [Deltaproteobacteria bacterium]
MEQIAILGAGSWGTALAKVLAERGHGVTLWAYEAEVAETITRTQRNPLYLSDITLPAGIVATSQLAAALADTTVWVLVMPSQHVRAVMQQSLPHLTATTTIVCCAKGIECGTGMRMSEILAELLPASAHARCCVLSGPSFAKEVAERQPTAVVIAGTDAQTTTRVQEMFRTDYFLTFTHRDVIGVELGGALKNVMALATGMVEGMGLGHNTRAALITRGLYEMIKLGKALGADPLTFAGLSGLGDLVLTCTGALSRNRHVGIEIGRGRTCHDVMREMRMVAEGVETTKAVQLLIQRTGVFAPICSAVHDILYTGKTPTHALLDLVHLDLKEEFHSLLG